MSRAWDAAGANESLLNKSVNEGMVCSLVSFVDGFPCLSEFLKIIAPAANQSLTMSQAPGSYLCLTTLHGKFYCYAQFTEEETEAQRGGPTAQGHAAWRQQPWPCGSRA